MATAPRPGRELNVILNDGPVPLLVGALRGVAPTSAGQRSVPVGPIVTLAGALPSSDLNCSAASLDTAARYEAVRAEHTELCRHLSGSHQRLVDGRQRDVAELRQARQGGRRSARTTRRTPRPTRTGRCWNWKPCASRPPVTPRRTWAVAAEVAEDYRASLAKQAEKAHVAALGMVEEIKARAIELRTVVVCQQWLDQVTASPPVRVKAVAVDTSGIGEAVRPVELLLAGPSAQPDLGDYLATLTPIDRAGRSL